MISDAAEYLTSHGKLADPILGKIRDFRLDFLAEQSGTVGYR